MRRAILLTWIGILPAVAQDRAAPPAPAAAKEPAIIEGRVVNAVTGEPLRKVNLRLFPSGQAGVGMGPLQILSSTTDTEGKFKFEDVEPGRYSLSAEKTGFTRQQYGARTTQLGPGTLLTLVAGQRLKDLEFKLTPQAVISGKVIDEDGEPVSNVSVQVLRHSTYSRRPMNAMGGGTNDVGEFRLSSLASGKYILRADYRRGMFGAAGPAQRAGEEGAEDYVTTFYPGVTEAEAAVPIEVRAGQELTGIDIPLRKARVYRVRGKVLGAAMDSSPRLQVSAQLQRQRGAMLVGFGGGNVKPDGSFEVPALQPGSYVVTVLRFDAGRPQIVGRAPVTISRSNVDGVIVQAGAALDLAGKVVVEGDDNTRVTGSVYLQPAEGLGVFGVNPARIQNDGTFKLESVSHDRYFVTAMGLPEGMYVKRVEAGGAEVLEKGLDLSAGSAPALTIVLSPKSSTIEGAVRDEDKPQPGAIVMLAPEPMTPERVRRLGRTSSSDQNGRFTMKGVAPGEYRLYALEEPMSTFDLEPEDLKPFDDYAVKITAGEGSREQAELKLAHPRQP